MVRTRSNDVHHNVTDERNTGKLIIDGLAMQESATVAGVVKREDLLVAVTEGLVRSSPGV